MATHIAKSPNLIQTLFLGWWASNRADVERVRNEHRKIRKKLRNYHDDLADCSYHIDIHLGVLDLNEVIAKEMIEGGYVPEVIFDKLEEYKTAIEWMETFKYLFKTYCEENGVKSWETEYFKMTYVDETESERVDTKKMKETDIYVMDAVSGELEEVNAYEFFSKKSTVKAHVTYKEKQ